jgi:hypothetical protein
MPVARKPWSKSLRESWWAKAASPRCRGIQGEDAEEYAEKTKIMFTLKTPEH